MTLLKKNLVLLLTLTQVFTCNAFPVIIPADALATFTYNVTDGFLDKTTNPLNQETQFQYDLLGRPLTQVLPDLREIAFTYDANSNLTALTPPGKPQHAFGYNTVDLEQDYTPPAIGLPEHRTQYAYNLDKELTTLTRPDGQMLTFDYNIRGQIKQVATPTRTLDFSYLLPQGTLGSINTSDGESLTFTYDGSLPLSTTWAGTFNGSVSQTFDNDFKVVSQSINGGNTVSFAYDNDSLLTSAGSLLITRSPLNGLITGTTLGSVTDTRTYNPFGETASYTADYGASNVASFDYTRDNLGRITQKIETVSRVTNTFDYVYDLTGRLTDVSKNGINISHYEFDTNGNRTSATLSEGAFSATYDDQDRLLSAVIPAQAGTFPYSYTYTANGELQSKINTVTSEVTSYQYDVLGNLVSVTLPDSTLIEYVIDAQNRRIGKKVNGTLVKGWLYQDSLNPIAELDGSGNIVSRFVYGSWPYCPDYMTKGGQTYRIIQDHLGSPRVIVNANTGTVAQELDFDEYGNVLGDSSPAFQPFGFAGGLYDEHTGLVRFGARDYDPLTGRWTAKDPIGFEGGDSNLYAYCGNDPVNCVDMGGESIEDVAEIALAGIRGAAQGLAAAIDGAIPFFDPFANSGAYNPCDETFQLSQKLGGYSRDALLLTSGAGLSAQWIRIGNSFSVIGQFKTFGLRWGASPRFLYKVPKYLRKANKSVRKLKLPFKNWRFSDPGHFHFWKK